MRGVFPKRNQKKPKTAQRLRRYRCAICRKKGAQVASAPYYCPTCRNIKNEADWQ